MSHTIRDKAKLTSRINRIKGQLNAASQIVESEGEPYKLLQLLSSCRGALTGLMGNVIEGHILEHVVGAHKKKTPPKPAEK